MTTNPQRPASPISFQRALLEWSLGLRRNDDLPAAACDALEQGQDSPALRELAGLTWLPADQLTWELPPLVERVRAELDLPQATPEQAIRELALVYAQQIVDRETEPREGAALIWSLLFETGPGYDGPEDIVQFALLGDEWDDVQGPMTEIIGQRSEIDAEIIAAASGLLEARHDR